MLQNRPSESSISGPGTPGDPQGVPRGSPRVDQPDCPRFLGSILYVHIYSAMPPTFFLLRMPIKSFGDSNLIIFGYHFRRCVHISILDHILMDLTRTSDDFGRYLYDFADMLGTLLSNISLFGPNGSPRRAHRSP